MAHFYQKPNSKGTFYVPDDKQLGSNDQDKGKSTLTLQFGETAEVILWGKGPIGPGSTTPTGLQVVIKTMIPYRSGDPVNLSPLEQLIRITPDGCGDILLYAKLGDEKGPDYAAPLRIITVAERTPVAAKHVVMCSSTEIQDVRRQIQTGHLEATPMVFNSMAEFGAGLRGLRNTGQKISELEIFGHGNVGLMFFGDDIIAKYSIDHLKGQGFDRIFAPQAFVFLHNCWVAGSEGGNEFLKALAQVFLSGGGGILAGTNAWGIVDRRVTGKAFHLWGTMKWVSIAPGGRIVETGNFDAGTYGDHYVAEKLSSLGEVISGLVK